MNSQIIKDTAEYNFNAGYLKAIEEVEKMRKELFNLETLRILEDLPEEREYDYMMDKISKFDKCLKEKSKWRKK